MSGEAKLEMFDLGRWNTQTVESVKEVLARAKAPCIGYCVVFMDFVDKEEVEWKFKTMLAFDPNNPVPEEDRKKLERIMDGYAIMAQKLMDGDIKETH